MAKIEIDELKKDIESIDTLSLEEVNSLRKKYKALISKAKNAKDKQKTLNSKPIKKYKYPFKMYFGHEYRDVSHIFVPEQEYSEQEITDALIEHGFKEFKFAKEINYEYFADENCLFPKLQVGNRG